MRNIILFTALFLPILACAQCAFAASPPPPQPQSTDCIHFRLPGDIRVITLSPDGKSIAVLTSQHLFSLVDVGSGEEIAEAQLSDDAQEAVAFTPDRRMVLIGSSEPLGGQDAGELLVFDIAAKRITHRLLGSPSPIVCLDFSHTGRALITGAADGSVSVWDPVRWRVLRSFAAPPPIDKGQPNPTVLAMSCSPDDSTVAVRDQSALRLISTTNGKLIARKKLDITSLAFTGKGNALAVAIWYDDTPDRSVAALRFLQSPSLRTIKSIRVGEQAGWYLHELTAIPRLPLVAGITDQGFAVWDSVSGKQIGETRTPQIIRSLSFSTDGARFAYVDINGMVNIVPTSLLLTGKIIPAGT